MLKSYVKTLAIAAVLGWANTAGAVGFGEASVGSALGQPLKVEIALTAVGDADRNGMTARLAPPDAFKSAGLDYPYNLTRLKFDIVTRGRQTVIVVTSREPVNDSFLNLLVELNWPSGRLVREYTLLLDPPDYKPEMAKPEPVAPIEPVIATPPVEVPPVAASAPEAAPVAASAPEAAPEAAPVEAIAATPASAPEAATSPIQEVEATPASAVPQAQPETLAPVEAQPAPAQPAAVTQPQPVQEKAPAHETITVKRGDTLSKIAAQIKEPDMTLEQMLVALYRANAKQFEGRNMNRIRAGKILTIPEPDEYEHLSQAAAVKEIRVQTANWQAYRQKLAAAGTTPVMQTPKQATGGKISTSVADQTPPAKQPGSAGTLVLSKGETPGDKTVASGKQAKDAVKEDAIAKQGQTKETEQRIAAQEKINQDLKKGIELKGAPPVPASGAAPAAASGAAASSGVAAAKPRMPATPASAVPAAETSILDDILDNPMLQDPVYLGGGAAILLAVIGGGVFVVRRRRNEGGGGRSSALKKKR